MSAALLTYSCSPDKVGIGSGGATGRIGITFLVTNKGATAVPVEQISLVLPRGDGATDLLAANSTIVAGSVRSSNGDAWTASVSGNQVVLMPVTGEFSRLEHGDILQFTLSDLQVNASGAGQDATIPIGEYLHERGMRNAQIQVRKIKPHFHIASFYLDQYKVAPGSPVIVTWDVVGALSCEVSASVIELAPPPHGRISPVDPAFEPTAPCSGTIDGGTALSGSHACVIQGVTIFTLSARGKDGDGDVTLTSQLLLTVNEAVIKFTVYPPDICMGQETTLNWRAADAGELVLYTMPDQGDHTKTDLTATPSGQLTSTLAVGTRYSLCAFTTAGDTKPAQQIELSVSVEKPAWKSPPVASISPAPIPYYPGDSATLSWEVQNAEHCRISCALPGFAPIDKLPPKGSQAVVLPDPGVASGPVTFTVTPVAYGGLGDTEPMSVAVPVSNVPTFLTLVWPGPVAPGGEVDIAWKVIHADAGQVSSNLPGDVPQPADPKAPGVRLTMPNLVIPTPVDFTLTIYAQDRKYSAHQTMTVGCTGASTTIWCNNPAAVGTSYDYLYLLNFQTPGKRISKMVLEYIDGSGVSALKLWYGDPNATSPDYVLPQPQPAPATSSTPLTMQPGEYLVAMKALYQSDPTTNLVGNLCYLELTTSAGQTVEIGTTQPSGTSDGPYQVSAPAGQQIIAISWLSSSNSQDIFCGLAAVCVTASYGQ